MDPEEDHGESSKNLREDDEENKNSKKIRVDPPLPVLTYDILRVLFQYLNVTDLINVNRVCRLWKEASDFELKIRPKISCNLVYFGKKKNHKLAVAPQDLDLNGIAPNWILNFGLSNSHALKKIKYPQNCEVSRIYGATVIFQDTEDIGIKNHSVSINFAKIPDTDIKTINIPQNFCKRSAPEKNRDPGVVEQAVNRIKEQWTSSSDEATRVVILFTDGRYSTEKVTEEFLAEIEKCNKPYILFGGKAQSVKFYDKESSKDPLMFYAMSIYSKQLKAFTTVLDENCVTKKAVETQLEKFKETIVLKKHSVALVYACCGRGKHMFKERNVESEAFKKIFPDIPLAGSAGYGEYSRIVSTTEDGEESVTYMHAYCTVILILTYGS